MSDIFEQAKDAASYAYKKSVDGLTMGKQKFDIAAIQMKLSKDYEKLGRVLFSSFEDSEDALIAELVNEIKEKNLKIQEIKDEIEKNSAKIYCTGCGRAIPKDSLFCRFCGKKI